MLSLTFRMSDLAGVRRAGPLIRRATLSRSINILRWLFCFIPQEGRNLRRRLDSGWEEGRRWLNRQRSEGKTGGNYFDEGTT